MNTNTCSFIGYATLENEKQLQDKLEKFLLPLIYFDNYKTFIFYSYSPFEKLAYNCISKLKQTFPYIKRIAFLTKENSKTFNSLELEEKFMLDDKLIQNFELDKKVIDSSDFCIFNYNEYIYAPLNYKIDSVSNPLSPEEITKQAYYYAESTHTSLINIY